jgi:hypothetical protein
MVAVWALTFLPNAREREGEKRVEKLAQDENTKGVLVWGIFFQHQVCWQRHFLKKWSTKAPVLGARKASCHGCAALLGSAGLSWLGFSYLSIPMINDDGFIQPLNLTWKIMEPRSGPSQYVQIPGFFLGVNDASWCGQTYIKPPSFLMRRFWSTLCAQILTGTPLRTGF